jgi:hypothetical protein
VLPEGLGHERMRIPRQHPTVPFRPQRHGLATINRLIHLLHVGRLGDRLEGDARPLPERPRPTEQPPDSVVCLPARPPLALLEPSVLGRRDAEQPGGLACAEPVPLQHKRSVEAVRPFPMPLSVRIGRDIGMGLEPAELPGPA